MSNSTKTVEMIPEFETYSEILKVNKLCSNQGPRPRLLIRGANVKYEIFDE